MNEAADADVMVLGGGPAGAAVAITLARRGRRVILAHDEEGRRRVGGESLPPSCAPLLRALGIDPESLLVDGHLRSPGNVSSWGGHLSATDFVRSPYGAGLALDRARFDARLRAVASHVGVRCLAGWLAVGDVAAGVPRLRGSGGTLDVRARWLVDATGRAARVARRRGATRLLTDRLIALVASYTADPGAVADEDARTLVESAPGGWWYSMLTPSRERLVAFVSDADLVDRACRSSTSGFERAVEGTEQVSRLLRRHGYALHARPRNVDARSGELDRAVGDGWLAVGDAAWSVDPLSSQGMTNALYTGVQAGRAIDAALAGDGSPLAGYEAHLLRVRQAYRANLAEVYAREPRWADHPFWYRRAT